MTPMRLAWWMLGVCAGQAMGAEWPNLNALAPDLPFLERPVGPILDRDIAGG